MKTMNLKKHVAIIVRGKMNLPSCGKEFFPHTVSRFFFAQ